MDGTEWRTEETQVLERVAATFREEFTDLSKLVRASTKEAKHGERIQLGWNIRERRGGEGW